MADHSILIVGSANLDLVFACERFPGPGETLLGSKFATHPGGKGANQAVAAGRLGGNVSFCGCVGRDSHGDALRQSMAKSGVDLTHLKISEHSPSGTACILVDAQGSNEIVVAAGSNFDLKPEDVTEAMQQVKPSIVVAQLEIPMDAVAAASQADCFILNPAPAQKIPDGVLSRCQILTPNESELSILTGEEIDGIDDVKRAAQMLLDKGVKNIVVTLGSEGCLLMNQDEARHFPAWRVKAVDTTAAGDSFNGALAHFMAAGKALVDAIPMANAAAAISVTRPGAQGSMPTMAEVSGFLGAQEPE